MNDKNLKNTLKKSLFLTQKRKQEFLEYFERLSPEQKILLEQAMIAEKTLLLSFLRQLKTKPELKASHIQEHYKKYRNSLKRQREFTEELQTEAELENLLLELENT